MLAIEGGQVVWKKVLVLWRSSVSLVVKASTT